MNSNDSQAHELLADVEATIVELAKQEFAKTGTEPGEIPKRIAKAAGEHLATVWGGSHIYFPKDIPRRNARIYDDFKGDNINELRVKYRLSEPYLYQVIAAERERRRIKQLSLPGVGDSVPATVYE